MSVGDRGSSRVVVRFADDELLEGDASSVDLDHPEFELVLADPDANSSHALIPLPSVKCLTLERRAVSQDDAVETLPKVALRFLDGEVVKGLLVDGPHRSRYGVTLELLSPGGDEIELLGIPYGNLKAVFYLKTWDSRPPEFFTVTGEWAGRRADRPLLELLGEIRRLADLRDRGHLDDTEFQKRRRVILDLI